MGMHFFTPVPIMQLVEIVKTIASSDDAIQNAQTFVKSLGKTSIVSPDIPGLLANRLIASFYISAIRMVEANTAMHRTSIRAMRLGLQSSDGLPFAVLDLIRPRRFF